MTDFPIHTLDSAPEDARPLLSGAAKAFGMIPNLFAVFAEAPALLRSYLQLGEIFEQSTAFDATERQILLLATSHENGCEYCVAAHSAIAGMQEVPPEVIQGMRDGTALPDSKLEALRSFARTMVQKRGWATEEEVQAFLGAGYSQRHVLEVILAIGFKTLSNYTNHLARTPLDDGFQSAAWSKPKSATT